MAAMVVLVAAATAPVMTTAISMAAATAAVMTTAMAVAAATTAVVTTAMAVVAALAKMMAAGAEAPRPMTFGVRIAFRSPCRHSVVLPGLPAEV